jgi:hypothetical protein
MKTSQSHKIFHSLLNPTALFSMCPSSSIDWLFMELGTFFLNKSSVRLPSTLQLMRITENFIKRDRCDARLNNSLRPSELQSTLFEQIYIKPYEHEHKRYVGFEVPTAVVMKSFFFRDKTPCSPLESQPSFGRNTSPPSG